MVQFNQAAARRDKPRRRIVLRWIALILTTLLLISGFVIAGEWNQPLGPQLALTQPSPTIPITGESNPLVEAPSATTTPQPAREPQCGGPSVMFIMLVGKDTDAENYETGFADVIRIARVDFVNPSVGLLSVPRDLFVRIPGLEQHQIVEARLKTAYPYGYAYDIPGGGPSLLAQTLVENFGFRIDHYAVTNYVAFEQAINAIGGVDIYLAAPVGDFPPGWVHMSGSDALQYARLRQETSNPSDLNRIDRQTQILDSIRRQVMSPQVISNLPALIASVQDMVLTDMSPADISMLACLSDKIEVASIQMGDLNPQLFTSQIDAFGYEILIPDYNEIRAEVNRFNAGQLMSDSSSPK